MKLLIAFLLLTGFASAQDLPARYGGEGAKATRELGQVVTDQKIETLAKALRTVKADTKTLELQKEFFDRVKK
ncbi:MAG: hypothetical protein ABI977_26170 [Acidobacteriota bacterium]